MNESKYFTYILRCTDNTLYTGITTDLERRMKEHFSQNEKCAKYTKRHKAKKLEAAWTSSNRKAASKLEYYIKHLSKANKEAIIKNNANIKLLDEKIDISEYSRTNLKYKS